MIRRAALLALVAVLLSLAGCWSRIEVNDLAIVSMMAIDKAETGEIQVWIQVVNPIRAGGAPGVTGAPPGGGADVAPYVTLSARGRTILEATRDIQTEVPRRIFWAHMRVILVGERLAREGLRQVTDFLTRHRELRLTNYLLVSRGSPEAFMAAQVDLERLPEEYLRELSRSRIGTAITLGEWAKLLAARGADPILGAAELSPPPAGAPRRQQPGLRLGGTALFQDDRLVGFMDEHVTRGLLWLRGEVHLGVVTVQVPQAPGYVSVEWLSSRVTRQAWVEDGRAVIYVQARTEGDVSEESADLDLSKPAVLEAINTQMNREIRRRMEAALAQMRELNVDSAGLGEVVHQQLPQVWRRVEKRWLREEFRRAKVVIDVDARVRRTGLSSKPRGIREEELIEGAK